MIYNQQQPNSQTNQPTKTNLTNVLKYNPLTIQPNNQANNLKPNN